MILGIDTSCYTTSMVLLNATQKTILFEENTLLKVKLGEKGLRQSDGFFQHSSQLIKAYEALCQNNDVAAIKAVCVSDRPRSVEGSYMPVFMAGVHFAKQLSLSLNIPLYTCSHQDGHLMAALQTCGIESFPASFYAIQISGGTTELLDASYEEGYFTEHILGASLDLQFGQLIDRIGVALGLSFPCGAAMEAVAGHVQHSDAFKLHFKNETHFNISGLENKYMKMIEEKPMDYIARHLFNTIGESLLAWISPLCKDKPMVIAGGVASNAIIRDLFKVKAVDRSVYFAQPRYSKDNALGVACIGAIRMQKENACV